MSVFSYFTNPPFFKEPKAEEKSAFQIEIEKVLDDSEDAQEIKRRALANIALAFKIAEELNIGKTFQLVQIVQAEAHHIENKKLSKK